MSLVLPQVPDMTSTTKLFTQMQQLYKDKVSMRDLQSCAPMLHSQYSQANLDLAAVTRHVQRLLASVALPADHIEDEYIQEFCKNTHSLRLFRLCSNAGHCIPLCGTCMPHHSMHSSAACAGTPCFALSLTPASATLTAFPWHLTTACL